MASFKLLKSETKTLTREQAVAAAEKHAGMDRSPTEREFDAKRTKYLVEILKGGHALPFCWATAVYQGKVYRMNGQHSSRAIVEAGEGLPEKVVVHLDHYEPDGMEGMALLFRQFDARWSGRSRADVAGAYQGLVEPIAKCSKKRVKLAVEGIVWFHRTVEGVPTKAGDDVYMLMHQEAYHDFIKWFDRILSVKTPELEKAPLAAAMYHTFVTSETGSQEFWSAVAKGDFVDDQTPGAVLSKDLVKIKEEKTPTKPGLLYAKCIKAWNAFRAGTKVRVLDVNTKKGWPEIAA